MPLMDDWHLKRELAGLKAEVQEWQKRVESYQEENEQLKADLRSAERELETARLDKVDLSARVIELDAELCKLRECGAAGWRSPEDEPSASGQYLVTTDNGFVTIYDFYKKREGDECSFWDDGPIRGWQPLPAAAKKEGEMKTIKRGTVYRSTVTSRKVVARTDQEVPVETEVICEQPHDDGDFSYWCGLAYCRCSS